MIGILTVLLLVLLVVTVGVGWVIYDSFRRGYYVFTVVSVLWMFLAGAVSYNLVSFLISQI